MLKCKNCIHYIPPRYDIEFASSFGRCKKFSKNNVEYADICRMNELKCGKKGKYFEKEPHLYTKMIKHHLLCVAPLWAPCAVTVVCLFSLVDLLSR